MKRFLSILLTLTMIVGLSAAAFAAIDTSIVVTGTVADNILTVATVVSGEGVAVGDKYSGYAPTGTEGQYNIDPATKESVSITITPGTDAPETVTTSYDYYQLLRATISGSAVSYYLLDTTDDTLRALLDAVTVDEADLFTFTKSADGTQWICTINKKADNTDYTDSDGEKIAAALNTDAIKAAAISHDTFAQSGTSEGSAVANGLDKGYYLITSTLGTKLVLQTLNDVTIATKNTYPTNTKTASTTNMNVGDHVTYTIRINIPATAKVGDEWTVHDKLDNHLAILNASEVIAASATDYAITAVDGTGNDVDLTDGTPKSGETFAKKFTVTSAMLGSTVVITYKAELLSTAADDTGYVNEAYTNGPAFETVPSEVPVYTFDFDFSKSFVGDEDNQSLTAIFELRTNANDEDTAISFTGTAPNYVKADSDDEPVSTQIQTGNNVELNISGLAAGTYYLVEISTSAGYNLLTGPVTVVITDTTNTSATPIVPSHTYTLNGSSPTPTYDLTKDTELVDSKTYYTRSGDEGNYTYTPVESPDVSAISTYYEVTGSDAPVIENNSGSVLPSTGGIGTTIFYIVGGLLAVGAGVVLVTKKRMGKVED